MLTYPNVKHVLRIVLLAAAVVFASLVALSRPAVAEAGCEVPPGEIVEVPNPAPGEADYKIVCPGDDTSGEDGDGGTEPTCDLSQVEGVGWPELVQYWCEGQDACWANIPAGGFEDPDSWPGEPPTEDSVYIYKTCIGPDGEQTYADFTWYEPDEPSIFELAQQAFGNLVTPSFELEFNPPERSYVTIDTWWWASGAGNSNIIGTAALGVRAIGEPDHIEVKTGDGTTKTCPWVVEKSDECVHIYKQASVQGTATAPDGSPAYLAQARLVYDVHFEQNGVPIEGLAGLPTTLESPWEQVSVPVAEIQGIVTE